LPNSIHPSFAEEGDRGEKKKSEWEILDVIAPGEKFDILTLVPSK
jgi:hypothetical protein